MRIEFCLHLGLCTTCVSGAQEHQKGKDLHRLLPVGWQIGRGEWLGNTGGEFQIPEMNGLLLTFPPETKAWQLKTKALLAFVFHSQTPC